MNFALYFSGISHCILVKLAARTRRARAGSEREGRTGVPRGGCPFFKLIHPLALESTSKTPPAPPGIMYPRFFAFPSFFGVHSSLGAGFFFCCLCARLVLRRGMRVASMDALLLQWGSAA